MLENQYIETKPEERQQFYWVGLFYFFTKTCIEKHGLQGEAVIRQAIRNYGTERGKRMRGIAESNGWPIDLETLFNHGDLISDPRFIYDADFQVLEPEVYHAKCTRCPNAEMWAALEGKELGTLLRYGSIYCEEIHHYLYGQFDSAVQVNLCETLANGGGHCHFYIHCRKANQKGTPQPPYTEKSWDDFGDDCTASINTMFGLLYYHMAKMIRDELGEDTLREGLRAFARHRGERLRELNRRAGLENTPDRLVKEGDIFLDFRFQVKPVELTPLAAQIEVHRCVLAEIWKDHHAEDLGKIFCEEVYKGICETYNPGILPSVESTLLDGPYCALSFRLKD